MIKQCCCRPVQTPEIAADLHRPRKEPRPGLPLVWKFDPVLVSSSKYCVAKILRGPVGQDDGALIG
ncbi:hypothetical protein C6A85_45015 [Mycobacterium sp. ITM-2017-0098]|nr:hypothetical protein C6A85_45015 [Mycobacterium sp. ITM-2017-0098]